MKGKPFENVGGGFLSLHNRIDGDNFSRKAVLLLITELKERHFSPLLVITICNNFA